MIGTLGCNTLRVMTDAGLDTESARSGPRERLMLKGEQALSDAELLAIVLGTGTHNDPVGVVAQRLLDRVGGLVGLQRAGLAAISASPGIGATKACRLRAALELGTRANSRPFDKRAPIRCSNDVAAALRPRLRDEGREHFFALALDVRQRPIAEILVAVGSLRHARSRPATCSARCCASRPRP